MNSNQLKLSVIIATGSAILVSQAIHASPIQNSSDKIIISDQGFTTNNQKSPIDKSRGDRASGMKKPVTPAGTK